MSVSRVVELEGHIIDSGMMQACFGIVMDLDGAFDVEEFRVGRSKTEESYCRMTVTAEDPVTLQSIVHELHQHGANPADPQDAHLTPASADRVVPEGFYSTTNHPTEVRFEGEWLPVERIEMDCAVVVHPADEGGDRGAERSALNHAPDGEGPWAETKVLNAIEAGDLVVTGETGIRVHPPERPREKRAFGFMQGGVSAERPSESTISQIAEELRRVKADGGKVLVVAGPAVIHTGAREALARLVREGYVDMLSAGNGFAVHDIERDRYGTSLGMDTETLDHPRKGHKHHIYTISEVIRAGGIPEAVAEGLVDSGVMYECVENDVEFVLAGSIRDDGPLPDTITDAIEAQNALRRQAHEADMVMMLSTLLHSVAVGNCLPSTTRVVCVDINPATVTQLLDRGSAQAVGMVTDVGTFVPTLADYVLAEES
ncbi:TIGR00300 family protein [Halomarina rubra]|uniref:Ornithine cyclodeaminase n=1 Tax=Halomarina rubra TaxID=2071873 RepID=A0ABD6AW71_9EURY|nr:TIGR00300 family protein [Halomarina rubra]